MGYNKQRVKPVDVNGKYLTISLKEYRQKYPDSIIFHSPFEWRCYIKLQKRKWKFSCQPTAIELIPPFKCTSFVKGKVVTAKVQDAVYTPDFLIETEFGNVYIECKGYFDDTARMRFKMCQYTLNKIEGNVILLIKTDLEFDKLLSLIDSHFNFKKTIKIEL